jgi:hypothetical protein
MARRQCSWIGCVVWALIASAPAHAQTLTATTLSAWTGEWVLDESRSDPPLMGARAPRQERWEPTTLKFLEQDGALAVERSADGALVRREFSVIDGESRQIGNTVSKLSWTAKGPMFETWETVRLPMGTDTIYERQLWTRDATGALVVTTELRTQLGMTTRRAVYVKKASVDR